MNFYRILELKEQEWDGVPLEKRKGYKQFKRWENFWFQRTYPHGNFPEGTEILNEYLSTESKMKDNPTLLSKEWQSIGLLMCQMRVTNKRVLGESTLSD